MLNAAQILALAPDAASALSGKTLATGSKWKNLAASEAALWGECQGSGKDPYRTGVDLSDYTAKCSCPSRKFPCKHATALMLLHAANPLESGTPPDWLTAWLEGRQKRAEAKTAPPASPEDLQKTEKAAAKRSQAREKKVQAGLEELQLWLADQIKNGIASAPSQPYSYWETVAARLVDAQAPGLARIVRALPTAASTSPNALLEQLARLHLIASAYSRLPDLPEAVQADVRSAVGFTKDKAELLQQTATRAVWHSLGQILVQEDNLRVRRTYLQHSVTREPAMLLDFAVANQPMTGGVPIGFSLETELMYYPSNLPLRAVLKPDTTILEPILGLSGDSIATTLEKYATALAKLPWLELYPVGLEGVVIVFDGSSWWVQDTQQILMQTAHGWQMLALSGGHPVQLFGEYNGTVFVPLTLYVAGAVHTLGTYE